MARRPLNSMVWLIGLISLVLWPLSLVPAVASTGSVTPTNEWVNFFSSNTTLVGQPVPVGAIIAAYASNGVQCAEFTVTIAGHYGVMPCYRDDPTTPQQEGALAGDVISFTINGLPATAVPISLNNTPVPPSTTITWTWHGDLWEVDLQVVATPTPTPTNTATPTPTATPTFTPTNTATPSPTATATPTNTATPSPTPTATSTPTAIPGAVARPVGGYGEPLSALELLAPWIILVAGVAVVAIGAGLLGRHRA